ncbi:SDR family NAD(P)-dependent oxidoreductase [Halorientalis regularis]|jgi:3-oxoacyl-[acyl-carrier protein] reductase|uniref:NADP-dependent 3-hydroxy acid dehydrogenase YdfG n=1 Tax=Halorientalis regularis TaxID=660518 RepID=A0A1G7I8R9_9EURY|nr:SDR family oxidoreductase [Halorientalis regularis]SDF08993.1 NADP-dependent 3-hydroxy acid dehydrogenase YdfG [Halorientalis regularis]
MDGDTTVVTGASKGIGAAVVREFAAAGAHVVACARDADELDDLAATVESTDGTVTTQRADVRDEFDVERLMETAAREGGGIDTVVANAGVYHGQAGETPLTSEAYAAFDDHLRTNGRGTFTTIRESLPHLAADARILVTSGSVAREAKPGYGSYAVSKATAEAVARGFAADLDHPVGVVDPGVVATDLTGGTGRDPADVAPMFRWAATDATAEDLDGGILDLQAWKRATR